MDEENVPKKKRVANPTGKGGFRERPHDMKDPHEAAAIRSARIAKEKEEAKERKAFLFREHQQKLKENLFSLAISAEKENTRLQATTTILGFIADGNPDKILEPSQEDEFGTLDEKLKQISDVYIASQLKNQELEAKIAKLERQLAQKETKEN